MSVRNSYPKAVLPKSHYFVTFARGDTQRCFAVRPSVLVMVLGLFPLCALIYLASTMVMLMRDDMLNALMRRQGAMQGAYEERLADMRSQIDLVTSRQLLDQNSLEARIHEMLSRQVQLENRAAVIATLADGVGGMTGGAGAKPAGAAAGSSAVPNSIPMPVPRPQMTKAGGRQAQLQNAPKGGPLAAVGESTRVDRSLPTGTTSFTALGTSAAPAQLALSRALALPQALGQAQHSGPQPGPVELIDPAGGRGQDAARPKVGAGLLDPSAAAFAADPSLPASTRVGALSRSLQRIEIEQIRSINKIGAVARAREAHLRRAIAATGLSPDRLKAPAVAKDGSGQIGVGGPFVPFKLDPNGSIFEREVLRFQDNIVEVNRLSRIVQALPISRPVGPGAQQTSGFGTRVDPFNGRLATHTGLDFRESHGAAVRASGAGVVVGAGPAGGYGNMVEIDHGNGVTTRYAHLSAILVRDGQRVSLGTQVGKIGSTGRSTGPHLHYEVRHNDQPLDPRHFLAVRERFGLR